MDFNSMPLVNYPGHEKWKAMVDSVIEFISASKDVLHVLNDRFLLDNYETDESDKNQITIYQEFLNSEISKTSKFSDSAVISTENVIKVNGEEESGKEEVNTNRKCRINAHPHKCRKHQNPQSKDKSPNIVKQNEEIKDKDPDLLKEQEDKIGDFKKSSVRSFPCPLRKSNIPRTKSLIVEKTKNGADSKLASNTVLSYKKPAKHTSYCQLYQKGKPEPQ